ncbi:MAG: type II toxin-antitoxin system RelB/DinJ family antitoxin [Kiritimatiellaeota bacterium]|nr:type II toxin-antitoxin system RelB/DinJ family antitoxin [Kiritimatiellota bacterium]
MATIQVRVDDGIKAAADSLFASLGFDTPTAVRIFLAASLEHEGLPFPARRRKASMGLAEALEDARLQRNLHGPFKTAEEAVSSMLEA